MNGLTTQGIAVDFANVGEKQPLAPLQTMFNQAAEDLGLTREELLLAVAEKVGFVATNLSKGYSPDAADVEAVRGLKFLLGFDTDSYDSKRYKISNGRAAQLAYVLRLVEDDLDH